MVNIIDHNYDPKYFSDNISAVLQGFKKSSPTGATGAGTGATGALRQLSHWRNWRTDWRTDWSNWRIPLAQLAQRASCASGANWRQLAQK